MLTGRRVDLDKLLSEGRALWQARLALTSHPSYRAKGWQVASALVFITTFFVALQSGYRLPQITLPELPSFIFPLVVLAASAILLYTIKPHLNFNAAHTVGAVSAQWDAWQRRVACSTASLHLRLSVQAAMWAYRLRDLTSFLVLPRLLPDGNLALLTNFVLVSLHTWTSRIQMPHVTKTLALHWQFALSEARRLWLSLSQLLHELIEPTHLSLAPAPTSTTINQMAQHTPRSQSPLVLNLRC
jgi:hypothetical protein